MIKQRKRILAVIMAATLAFQSGGFVNAAELSNPASDEVVAEVLDASSDDEQNAEPGSEEVTEEVTDEAAEEVAEETTEEKTDEVTEVISTQSVEVTDEAGDYVYQASELKVATTWGTSYEVNEEGNLVVTFPKQYDQIFLEIPKEIDPTRIEKITVGTDGSSFSIKLHADTSADLGVAYGRNYFAKSDLKEGADLSTAKLVDFMNLADAELVKEVSTVTFTLAKAGAKDVTPEDKPVDENGKLKNGTYKYLTEDLEVAAKWGTSVDTTDGYKVTFEKQYSQIFYKLPEDIEAYRIEKVVVETSNASFSVKFCAADSSHTELGVVYGNNTIAVDALKDNYSASDIGEIGLMNLASGEATKEIKSISFTIGSGVVVDETNLGDLTEKCNKTDGNNNPLVTQRYSADPGVMVYDDTVYIYSTNDVYQYVGKKLGENKYNKIVTINCFGSKDLVNWTDYGAIPVAGQSGAATWANNSWAPCAAHKTIDGKEKFFLYFADNGSGIGVLVADSPAGPFVDPIGKQLISRQTPNCSNVEWLFDPAVFVDDDGTGYLCFGGGVPNGKAADPGTARVVKLGDDMISLAGDPVQINPPYLFEDSGINKIGDKYVYSYCSNFNTSGSSFHSGTIQYMVSDDPMGPYEYVGEIFANPASFFNDGNGNNHHSLFEFNGKYYIAYHARAIEQSAIGKSYGYRSTQIDEVKVVDGKIQTITGTMKGVEAVKSLNPYETQKATTIYRQKGVEVFGSGDTVLTVTSGDFTSVKNAEFNVGVSKVAMTVKADEAMTIDIYVGNEKGTKLGTINVENTNGEYKTFEAEVANVTGTVNLYFVYNGSALVKDWICESNNVVTFDKLEEVEHYNLTYKINEAGAITISYEKKWGEIRLAIPESIDVTKLVSIKLNVTSDHGTMALKALPTFGGNVSEVAVAYGATELDLSSVSNKEDIKYIGIMTMSDDAFDVTIDSVVFEVESVKVPGAPVVGVETDVPDLKAAMQEALEDEDFLVGSAITAGELNDKNIMALVTKHFNAITFGNELKPDATFNYNNSSVPSPHYEEFNGEQLYVPTVNFDRGDKMLEYFYNWNAENPDNQIKIRGHVLTWHSQTPEWFFHEDYDTSKPFVDKETMTKRHEWYIKTVLTHYVGEDSKYKDLFYGWDVVNEAVSDSTGTYRNASENSNWWRVYGSNEFIINAFRFANKYAPADVELYYNDYNEHAGNKVKGIAQLLTDVKNAEGTRIDGFGMQGHYSVDGGATKAEFMNAARTYGKIVDKIQLTELDFKCSAEFDGTSATYDAENTRLAHRYLEIYDAIKELRAEGINFTGMTVWGVIDKNSWLQTSSSVGGGANGNKKQVPLLFDDNYHVKESYWAFVDSSKVSPLPQEEKIYVAPLADVNKGTVVVDGNIDAIWDKVEALSLDVNSGAKAKATAKLLWDDEYLYVLVNVKDAVLNGDNDNAHEKDSLEVFIDENNNKSKSYEDDDKQYRINYLNVHTFNGNKCKEENVKSEVVITEDGYMIEAAFKWTDIKPAVDTEIGFDLQINDADNSKKRIGTLNWYDKTGSGWSKPSVFGSVKLVDTLVTLPFEEKNDKTYYVVDGKVQKGAGLIQIDGKYYYVQWNGEVIRDKFYYKVSNTNGLLQSGYYWFDETGAIVYESGKVIKEYEGDKYILEDGIILKSAGLTEVAGKLYYVQWNGKLVTDKVGYTVNKTNDLVSETGSYVFDADGVMNTDSGIVEFDGTKYYVVEGKLQKSAGFVCVDGYVYYVDYLARIHIGGHRWVIKGNDIVNELVSSKTLKYGFWYFDEDGKLLDGKEGSPIVIK